MVRCGYMSSAQDQENNSYEHLKPWQFKKGQSGNPGGRPKGSVSLKEYARKMLREMDDEEKLEFLNGIDKDVIWKMSEGNPENKSDITSGGEPLPVLVKFIDGK